MIMLQTFICVANFSSTTMSSRHYHHPSMIDQRDLPMNVVDVAEMADAVDCCVACLMELTDLTC
jgi:hypothetical protein